MIKIAVDSSSDYSPAEAAEKGLTLIPISISLDNKTYLDGINLERNEFYEILEKSSDFPKTSQPSPQTFIDCFEKAKENGDELICILLSSGLSGTYQGAGLAKNMVDYDKIWLIDSLAATCMIRVMVDYASNLIAQGLSVEEVAARTDQFKSKVKVIAAIDTLEYLARGGRISKAAAAIGEMANLKPIITVTPEGTIGMAGKCLGRNKAISHIVKYLQGIDLNPDYPLYSLYSYGTENSERFEEKLQKAGYKVESRLQIGPVIGTHIGPNAFGLIYVEK